MNAINHKNSVSTNPFTTSSPKKVVKGKKTIKKINE
jgi:hypothetical protein